MNFTMFTSVSKNLKREILSYVAYCMSTAVYYRILNNSKQYLTIRTSGTIREAENSTNSITHSRFNKDHIVPQKLY